VVQLVVLCVKLARGISVTGRGDTEIITDGQPPVDIFARCPSGYAPVGTGFRHSIPGDPSQPVPQGTFVHTGELKVVPGGAQARVETIGPEPVQVRQEARCVERRDPGVRERVVRATDALTLQPGQQLQHTQTCPGGSTATSPGWSTPVGSAVLVDAVLPPRSRRSLYLLFANASQSDEQVQAHTACLSQTRSR
jgi:hypothetical protein